MTPIERAIEEICGRAGTHEAPDALLEAAAELLIEARSMDKFMEEFLSYRGIVYGDECPSCGGAGVRTYGTTATWRGGLGGAQLTTDVCDRCWGSGDKTRPWPSWKEYMERSGA